MVRRWYAALGAREQAECIEMMLTLTIFISITKMINVIVTLPLYNPNLIHCETFHLHRFVIPLLLWNFMLFSQILITLSIDMASEACTHTEKSRQKADDNGQLKIVVDTFLSLSQTARRFDELFHPLLFPLNCKLGSFIFSLAPQFHCNAKNRARDTVAEKKR